MKVSIIVLIIFTFLFYPFVRVRGVDFEIAKQLGVKTIWALSLPGKVAPYSAGEIIRDTILNILKERGML